MASQRNSPTGPSPSNCSPDKAFLTLPVGQVLCEHGMEQKAHVDTCHRTTKKPECPVDLKPSPIKEEFPSVTSSEKLGARRVNTLLGSPVSFISALTAPSQACRGLPAGSPGGDV